MKRQQNSKGNDVRAYVDWLTSQRLKTPGDQIFYFLLLYENQKLFYFKSTHRLGCNEKLVNFLKNLKN